MGLYFNLPSRQTFTFLNFFRNLMATMAEMMIMMMKIGIKIDDDHNDGMMMSKMVVSNMSKTVEAKMAESKTVLNLTASPSCTVISFSFHSQSAATKARKIT